jgi:hypothetical protein
MMAMVYISLGLNALVLVPVCAALSTGSPALSTGSPAMQAELPETQAGSPEIQAAVQKAWGDKSPSRGILLSMYAAILVMSIVLMLRPVPAAVAGLLSVQVLYKLTTPFTVGSVTNPVVVSNLVIAGVHMATVATIVACLGALAQ